MPHESFWHVHAQKIQPKYFCISGRNNQSKSKHAPERIITAINHLDIAKMRSIIFSWEDTKQDRSSSTLFTIINNREKPLNESHLGALKQYHITPLLWSDKDKHITKLAA